MKIPLLITCLSILLLTGCDVYTSLYGTDNQNQTIFVPESDIIMEQSENNTKNSDDTTSLEELSEQTENAGSNGNTEENNKDNSEESTDNNQKPASDDSEENNNGNQETSEKTQKSTANAESNKEREEIITSSPTGALQSIIVEETQLVSLETTAEDPDGDPISLTYSSPLDQNGRWQTNYGDAGEYTVTITASDDEFSTTQNVLIIVNKKEEEPVIDLARPQSSSVSIQETESVDFSIKARDLNNDQISISWFVNNNMKGEGSEFRYETGFDDEGEHTIKAEVSDGKTTIQRSWDITIQNFNRQPIIEPINRVTVEEGEEVVIEVSAFDEDGEGLTFSIDDSRFGQDENEFTWQTDFDSQGTYEVTVEVSDSSSTVSHEFEVVVENKNRKPVILAIRQG